MHTRGSITCHSNSYSASWLVSPSPPAPSWLLPASSDPSWLQPGLLRFLTRSASRASRLAFSRASAATAARSRACAASTLAACLSALVREPFIDIGFGLQTVGLGLHMVRIGCRTWQPNYLIAIDPNSNSTLMKLRSSHCLTCTPG